MQTPPLHRFLALLALIFGVMTVFSGGSVLFGPDETRNLAGAVVPLVLWFNFLAGFAYILGAVLIWRGHKQAPNLAILIAGATLLVGLIFAFKTLTGTAFEPRTIAALILRFFVWAIIALALIRSKRRTANA